MRRRTARLLTCNATLAFCLSLAPVSFGQTPATPQPSPQVQSQPLREVVVEGNGSLGRSRILERLELTEGRDLTKEPSEIAADLQALYASEGYTEARATAAYDAATARLTLRIDEGRIDAVEFTGPDEAVARQFIEDFDVRTGDVFNRRQILLAINRLLAQTEGAFRPAQQSDRSSQTDSFDLVSRDGKRVLVVRLDQRTGRFGMTFGTNDREDWYSSVDGLAPALGFSTTIFDPHRFNHTFISGYLSYKFERERVGYTFGFERRVLARPKLFVGGELHDMTASDDFWRLSTDEESLVALSFKNIFRDYYGRRGYQVNAALRFRADQEVQVSWRDERHDALANQTDYSFFRDDQEFRPNRLAQPGRLHAMVLGYTWDSRGLDYEGIGQTYRRHQLDDMYGRTGEQGPGIRIDATSEIASPDTFGGDFNFRRYVGNARAYFKPSPHQHFNARFIGGFGDGDVPPQRVFALGGIGSVHGYSFKEAAGERMALFNLEYLADLGTRHLQGLAFFDSGRVWKPVEGSRQGWLNGIGIGMKLDDIRVEFGWRLDDIPQSLQVLVRFSPTF